jgi:hypothetical protein
VKLVQTSLAYYNSHFGNRYIILILLLEEKPSQWLGRADNDGETMCYWILTDDTKNLIVRGTVRNAKNTKRPDMRYAGNPQDAEDEDEEDKPSADSGPPLKGRK